jgi:hypothetical protein
VRRLLLLAPCFAACAPDLTPTWGFDPIYLEPDGQQVYGFETWQIYAEKWAKKPVDRYYVCAVVVQLEGTPSSCPDCTVAWNVTAELVESDCAGTLSEDPLFTSVIGLGLGEPSTNPDAPHPDLTVVGWVDYGSGWEIHGDAWPEILDSGGVAADAEWDGEKAFTFWPGALWPLP